VTRAGPAPERATIRPARVSDLPLLPDIERAAGEQFRGLGMAAVADDEPPAPTVLQQYLDRGAVWVAADPDDRPVGYLLLDDVDGATHIEQVSVHPSLARRGLGRALIETAVQRARARGHRRVTLTTFTDVPWNAPYYRRLGFSVVPSDDQGPELRRLRAHEARIGLDRWPRVAMARLLDD
jgi:GNAT superfamily N-acetyltransferase